MDEAGPADAATVVVAAAAGAAATAEVFQLLTGWVGRGGALSAGMKSAREKEEGCAGADPAPAAAEPPALDAPNSERGAGAGEERALITGDLYAAIEADEETEEPERERTAADGAGTAAGTCAGCFGGKSAAAPSEGKLALEAAGPAFAPWSGLGAPALAGATPQPLPPPPPTAATMLWLVLDAAAERKGWVADAAAAAAAAARASSAWMAAKDDAAETGFEAFAALGAGAAAFHDAAGSTTAAGAEAEATNGGLDAWAGDEAAAAAAGLLRGVFATCVFAGASLARARTGRSMSSAATRVWAGAGAGTDAGGHISSLRSCSAPTAAVRAWLPSDSSSSSAAAAPAPFVRWSWSHNFAADTLPPSRSACSSEL